MKRKVLTTGGTGLVGSRVIELLSNEFEFIDASIETGIDLLEPRQVERFVKDNQPADTLVHFAAFTNVAEAEKQKGDRGGLCYRLNVDVTSQLARQCGRTRTCLIQISTDYVFGGKLKDHLYTEEDVPDPINWYGRTKYLSEVAVQESDATYTILRIAYPFRANFRAKVDFARSILQRLEGGTLYPMFSDQVITPTFVDDIAKGLRGVINNPAPSQLFHLVGATSLTSYAAAQIIAKAGGYDLGLVKEGSLSDFMKDNPERRSQYPRYLSLSNRKFASLYDVKLSGFREAVVKTFKQDEQ